jgi:predicted lipase
MKFFLILLFLFEIRGFNINNYIFHARLCKYIYNKNNNYLIIHNNKSHTLNICFRGTKNTKDIYNNLNIIPHNFITNKIKVHKGFLFAYLSIRDNIITNIKEIILNYNIENIYISGHSSGGAIANIASLDFYYLYPKIKINTITFGSPRFANLAFVQEYNKFINNSVRIVNKNDIIQHLPLPIIYKHIHEPLILDNIKYKNNMDFRKIHSMNMYINNLIIFNEICQTD